MKLDILAIAAHPDDIEMCCGATIAKETSRGKKVGIVDLTRGDLGTRGTAETRDEEAANASKILNLTVRENLKFRDGFFINDEAHQLEVIKMIRKYRPDIVITNAETDRHPDHGKGSKLVSDACFFSGLRKIKTSLEGVSQEVWRPKQVLHTIQWNIKEPDVVVDVTGYMDAKIESCLAYKTQFYNEDAVGKEPEIVISGKQFLESIKYRSYDLGRIIGVQYAEGFTVERYVAVDSVLDLI